MEILLSNINYMVFLFVSTMFYQVLTDSISNSSELKSNNNVPRMIPIVKQMYHKTNDRIEISCEADQLIFWTYPKMENHHNFGSQVEIENLYTEVHRSNLIVHNATFADTGFYRCYCSSMDKELRTSESTYVYVYDPNYLLAYWEYNVYNVYELNTTTLSWCRPTSPNVHVAIMLEGKTIVNSTYVSYPFTYDPRYGFTVDNIYENMVEGTYVCKATDFTHRDYKMIEVKFTAPPLILIKTEKEFYKPDEPISIECHISTSSYAFSQLDWNNDTIVKKNFDSNTVLSYNATAKQSGNVSCEARNKHGGRHESLEIFVTDLDKDCDVWEIKKNQSVNKGGHLTLECGATKPKYNDKIQWYFNNNSLLDTNQRQKDYKIVNYTTSYSHRSMLIITDVKYTDAGNYECRVEKKQKSCGQIKVDVQGKPLLSCSIFNQNETYEYYEMIQLHCRAISNPLPSNIECVYEVAKWTDKISTTSSEFDRQTVTFNPMLFLYASGKIRCKAMNRLGTSEISLDVNIASIYSNNTDVIVRNDSVVIPCRSKYPGVIMKLMHNDKEIASSVNASSPFNYDPNVGFIIQNPYENLNSSQCYCLPEHNGQSYPQQALAYKISDNLRVHIEQDSYEYEYNTTMTVRCVIFSFSPIEIIDWYFIRNDSTERKLNESLYTTTACSKKKDLCTEAILKMPANESGAVRCEVSSGSKKHSIVHYIHVNIKQKGMMYIEMILIISFIVVPIIFSIKIIKIIVKQNRRKNQKIMHRKFARSANNDLCMETSLEIPAMAIARQCETNNDSDKYSDVENIRIENKQVRVKTHYEGFSHTVSLQYVTRRSSQSNKRPEVEKLVLLNE